MFLLFVNKPEDYINDFSCYNDALLTLIALLVKERLSPLYTGEFGIFLSST